MLNNRKHPNIDNNNTTRNDNRHPNNKSYALNTHNNSKQNKLTNIIPNIKTTSRIIVSIITSITKIRKIGIVKRTSIITRIMTNRPPKK